MFVQDEVSTLQLLKGHQSVEQTVEAYAESVGLLSQQCQQLLEVGHPERCGSTSITSPLNVLFFFLSLGQVLTKLFCPSVKVSRS